MGLAPGGWLELGTERHELGFGGYGSLAASYRILDGRGEEPFLVVSLALGASAAPSEGAGERATLVGTDARAAFTLGKMFWRSFAPYAVVRLFGGPVLWQRGGEALVGTDRHHYQLGAGLLVTSETVGASLEVVPLGERNVTLGTTVAF